jgi:2-keto-4-pentenoate hydratase
MAAASARASIPGQETMLARAARLREAGAERVGWKVGHDIAEADGRLVVGALTSATILGDGATYAAGHPAALRAETELAVWLAGDVPAGAEPETARRAIAGLGVALELVDVGRPRDASLAGIVAAGVFHRAAVLGPCAAPLGATFREAALLVGGHRHAADQPFPDPVASIVAVADALGAGGEALRGGDVVLTGSVIHVPVAPGTEPVAEIAGLGRVSAVIGG